MYDVIEKIFAVILAVVLMFFFPLLDTFERMDDLSYMTVYAATVKFVDAVRNTGKITPEMYVEFQQTIDSTGNLYTIELLHRKLLYYPKKDNFTASTTTYEYVDLFDEVYTYQILGHMKLVKYNPTENIMEYTAGDDSRNYEEFSVGDYFYVSVKNESTTPATLLKKVLYGADVSNATIVVPYGGMVRNIPMDL